MARESWVTGFFRFRRGRLGQSPDDRRRGRERRAGLGRTLVSRLEYLATFSVVARWIEECAAETAS